MLSNEVVKSMLQEDGLSHVEVNGDGYHYQIIVVGNLFEGLTKLKRQQWVNAKLKSVIESGALHAITMSTYTDKEWELQHG